MRSFSAVVLTLVACGGGASEADARAHLEADGLKVTEVKKIEGGKFDFTGTKDKKVCKGVLTIEGGSSSFNMSCSYDLSTCKPGAVDQCLTIADFLYDENPKNYPPTAAKLYRIACDDKSPIACRRVGEFEKIQKQSDKAAEYWKKGCDLGDLKSCRDLAQSLFETGNAAGAIAPAEVACKGKHEDGCHVLGLVLFNAEKDYPRALELLEAGCKDTKFGRHRVACNLAGAIVIESLGGVPKDLKRGLAFFQQSCDADSADGCANLAKFLKDKAKRADAKAKACKLGDKESC